LIAVIGSITTPIFILRSTVFASIIIFEEFRNHAAAPRRRHRSRAPPYRYDPAPSMLRIVSRRSPLALWQAEHVRARLLALFPDLPIEISGIRTLADRFLDRPLSALGGKGLFVRELDAALLDGSADLAVHSMKDVPAEIPAGLEISVLLARDDARDVLVGAATVEQLPRGARVGTSSLRRRCQLLHRRPDLDVRELRGNVGTRLERLERGDFDALVLAAAGLRRLGLAQRGAAPLSPELMLPAVGQGVLGVECRAGDVRVQELIAPLHDAATGVCMAAERAFARELHGGCHVPIAGHAVLAGGQLRLDALVGRIDGTLLLRESGVDQAARAAELGTALAGRLLARGARDILDKIAASR
jgi:hydroxymethylbilane synthase